MAVLTKTQAAKLLADVPEQYVFRCHDSSVMNNMKQLAQQLNCMADETYYYHANAEKNDFSNWVADIIGDLALANQLKTAPERAQAVRCVADRVAFLSKKAGLKP